MRISYSPLKSVFRTQRLVSAIFFCIGSSALSAQTPVWQDDFSDPEWSAGWNISSSISDWTAVETGGWLRINEVAPKKGKGRFQMEANVPIQTGQLALALRLSCSRRDSLAADRTTVFTLQDVNGNPVATFTMEIDQFSWSAGGVSATADLNRYGPHSAFIQLSRNEAGNWKYSIASPYLSNVGDLGVATGSVSKIHIEAVGGDQRRVGRFPTSRTTVELDFIELYGPRGPRLTATATSGAIGDYHVVCDGFPAHGNAALLYGNTEGHSVSALAPCTGFVAPMGNAKVYQAFNADGFGTACFSLQVPPSAIGAIKIVVIDLTACTFSNVITLF